MPTLSHASPSAPILENLEPRHLLAANFSLDHSLNLAITSPGVVAVGDINGDGRVDIAAARTDAAEILVWRQLPNGTFANPITINRNADRMLLVDMDGDGNDDLLIADNDQSELVVIKSNGDGTFGAELAVASTANVVSLAVGDPDEDGDFDVYTLDSAQDRFREWANDGDGGLTMNSFINLANIHPDTRNAIVVGDLDGDGHEDVLIAETDNNAGWVIWGDGTLNNSADPFALIAGNMTRSLSLMRSGNGDPLQPVGSTASNIVRPWGNDGNRNLGGQVGGWLNGSDLGPMAVGDWDGDGDDDVVAGIGQNETLWFLDNIDASETLNHLGNLPIGEIAAWIVTADIGGDGDTDIIYSAPSGITVLFNQRIPGDTTPTTGSDELNVTDSQTRADASATAINSGSRIRVTVRNNTGKRIRLKHLEALLTGADADAFKIVSIPDTGIARNGTAEILVRFRPAKKGLHKGKLVIPTDNPNHPRIVINLRGEGVQDA